MAPSDTVRGSGPAPGEGSPSLLLLSLASALSPFGMVTIVPTLGAVAAAYAVDAGTAQFLISAYLFGLGLAQPAVGVLSDRIGRRPVLLAGIALFTITSAIAALVTHFSSLVLLRFLQATGVSVGTVTSRAVVRDAYDTLESAQAMAMIGAVQGLAPVIGPVVGGWLAMRTGAAGVFTLNALLGLLIGLALFHGLDETRCPAPAQADARATNWRQYRRLLGSPVFAGYTLMYACIQGCFFAFLAVGAFVFEAAFGLGLDDFGLIWGLLGVVYIAAATGAARLTGRLGLRRTLRAGAVLALLGALILLVLATRNDLTLPSLMIALAVLMSAAGILTPLSLAGAVNHYPEIAGAASGLSSSLGLALSGLCSILAGALYTGSFAPVALLMAGTAMLAAAMFAVSRPRQADPREACGL